MSNEHIGTASATERRDLKGRFAKGNPGGPGNPFGRKLAAYRAAILEAVTVEDIRLIMAVLVEKSLAGDLAAAKLVLQYAVGKPQPAADPDRVNIEEFEIAAEERIPYGKAVGALIDMPVDTAVEFATGIPPQGLGAAFAPSEDDDDHAADDNADTAEETLAPAPMTDMELVRDILESYVGQPLPELRKPPFDTSSDGGKRETRPNQPFADGRRGVAAGNGRGR